MICEGVLSYEVKFFYKKNGKREFVAIFGQQHLFHPHHDKVSIEEECFIFFLMSLDGYNWIGPKTQP